MKILEAIEARLKAATPGAKWLDRHAPHIDVVDPWGVMSLGEEDYLLAEHAPADLALLLRVVRSVAEAPCRNYGPLPATCATALSPEGIRLGLWCHPCRIRRELAKEEGR